MQDSRKRSFVTIVTKYKPGHKCKRRHIYLLEREEDGEMIGGSDETEEQKGASSVSLC